MTEYIIYTHMYIQTDTEKKGRGMKKKEWGGKERGGTERKREKERKRK